MAQGVIPVFLSRIIQNQKIEIWGDGEVTRDYIYIKDAVDLLVKSLNYQSKNKVFNLSSAKGYSLKELLKIMISITGSKPEVTFKEGREIDVPVSILDNALAKEAFNWKPVTDINTGINNTYNYLKKVLK